MKHLATTLSLLALAACGQAPSDTRPVTDTEARQLVNVMDDASAIAVWRGAHVRAFPTRITWLVAQDARAFVAGCHCYAESSFDADGSVTVTLAMLDGMTREPTSNIAATSATHEALHLLSARSDHDVNHADALVWGKVFLDSFNAAAGTDYMAAK